MIPASLDLTTLAQAYRDGLKPSALPSLQDIPNNHLAYAVQWFVFAGVAAAIYGLALWQRRRA